VRRGRGAAVLAVLLIAGCGTPKSTAGSASPSPSESALPSPVASSPSASPTPTPARPRVTKKALNYFFAITIGSEYAKTKVDYIVKWTKPTVTVRTDGTMTSGDRSCLATVITDFNALSQSTDLQVTTARTSDIAMHFASLTKFKSLEPSYVKGNDGFFHVEWTNYRLNTANILVRSTGITQTARCSIIREELTQAMGLMKDSYQYADSIFYQRYSTPTKYSALDKQIIALLYNDMLEPGMRKAEVTAACRIV
jgi:DUF2927 family protein